mmetsp:Transcript_46253/g.75470  ORF Transcript_46253/g.75470 Transcript_46253/m.75470 type:complete len:211 (+) Transcript_46253:2545-3177(+)
MFREKPSCSARSLRMVGSCLKASSSAVFWVSVKGVGLKQVVVTVVEVVGVPGFDWTGDAFPLSDEVGDDTCSPTMTEVGVEGSFLFLLPFPCDPSEPLFLLSPLDFRFRSTAQSSLVGESSDDAEPNVDRSLLDAPASSEGGYTPIIVDAGEVLLRGTAEENPLSDVGLPEWLELEELCGDKTPTGTVMTNSRMGSGLEGSAGGECPLIV